MFGIKINFAHFLIFFATGLASVHQGPQNEAVMAGQAIQMTCGEGSETIPFWFYRSPLNMAERLLYDQTKILIDSFSNTNATGRVRGQILSISPVRLENSGVFKCALSASQFSAQLIVLESKPVCGISPNANRRGFVDHWCRVNFTGFWPPHMQWTQGDRNVTSQQQRTPESLSSTLTVKVESDGDNKSYRCKTYFAAEDNTLKDEQRAVKNVPTFMYISPTDAVDNSATKDGPQAIESTTQHLVSNTNGIMWILTSCAAMACLVVFVVIVCYLRKHPDVCKKSLEPDVVQNAEIIQIGGYPVAENRVDVQPLGLDPDFEEGEPEQMLENNVDYAEVVAFERKYPSYMQDSPAWNNVQHGACSKSIQNSPAWSHSSKHMYQSGGAASCGGSPMVNRHDVEYLDINSVATIPLPYAQQPRRPPARLPTFQAVSYASIDHTSRPPPPLPPNDN